MPGCAKKLAVRSSLLSMMNTSLPVGVWLSTPDAGLPVAVELPPLGWSKSISLPSPVLSRSILGFSTVSILIFLNLKEKSSH